MTLQHSELTTLLRYHYCQIYKLNSFPR